MSDAPMGAVGRPRHGPHNNPSSNRALRRSCETRSARERPAGRRPLLKEIGPPWGPGSEPRTPRIWKGQQAEHSSRVARKIGRPIESGLKSAQLVVGDSKNTITLARSSDDVSPPYGFMLLPGTTCPF